MNEIDKTRQENEILAGIITIIVTIFIVLFTVILIACDNEEIAVIADNNPHNRFR